jgi:hypothetical protein
MGIRGPLLALLLWGTFLSTDFQLKTFANSASSARITSISRLPNGSIQIRMRGAGTNTVPSVEYSTDLKHWTLLAKIEERFVDFGLVEMTVTLPFYKVEASGEISVIDDDTAQSTMRFYRVRYSPGI